MPHSFKLILVTYYCVLVAPDTGFVLVEAFCQTETERPAKIQRQGSTEDDMCSPVLTAGGGAPPALVPSFLAAIKCLNFLSYGEIVSRGKHAEKMQWAYPLV